MKVESRVKTIYGVEVICVKFNQIEEYYTGATELTQLAEMANKRVTKNIIDEAGAVFYNGVPIIYHPALDS